MKRIKTSALRAKTFVLKYREVFGYLALVIALAVSFVNIHQVQSQQQASVKSNIESRVTTVAQRCMLTNLVTQRAKEAGWAQYPDLQRSLNGCYVQLAKVRKQAKATPGS